MTRSIALLIGLVLLVVLILFSTTYTVRYNEVAIRTRFGKTDGDSVIRNAGLHFRLPLFADRITTIDTRLQLRESSLDAVPTSDGQLIGVRAFMMWQVDHAEGSDGPLKFITHHPNGIEDANNWLATQFNTAVRTSMAKYKFDELIGESSRLQQAEQQILNEMANAMGLANRGIQPRTVGISQLVLPPKTTTAVLRRMEATRSYLSESERYKGDAEATGITSRADAQAEKIRTFASQLADEIRTAGNKDAAKYIEMMGEEPGLAIFLTWLDALEATLSEQTTYVVPTTGAPFHLLRLDTPTDSRGLPQPAAEGGRLSADQPTQPNAVTPTSAPAASASPTQGGQ